MSDIEFKKLESSSVISNFSVPEGYVTTWMEADSSGNPVMKAKKHGGDVVTVGGSSASGNLSSEAVEKLSVEPELNSANVGRVFQWAGASSERYRHGSIYEIRESSTAVPASASEPMKAAPAMMSLGAGDGNLESFTVKAGQGGEMFDGTYMRDGNTPEELPQYRNTDKPHTFYVRKGEDPSGYDFVFLTPGGSTYSVMAEGISGNAIVTESTLKAISFFVDDETGSTRFDVEFTFPSSVPNVVNPQSFTIETAYENFSGTYTKTSEMSEGIPIYANSNGTKFGYFKDSPVTRYLNFYSGRDTFLRKNLQLEITELNSNDISGMYTQPNGLDCEVKLTGAVADSGSGGGSSVSFPESFRITSPESFAGNYTKTGEPGTSYNGNTYPVYNGERRGSNISPRHFRCVVNSNGKYEFTAIEGNITCRSSNSVSDSKPFGANDLTGSYSGSGSTYYLMAEGNTVAPSISITSSNPLAITAETDKSSQVTVTWRCDNCAPGSNYVRFTKTEDSGNVATLDNDHPLESSVGQTTITIMASSEGNHTAKFDVELRDSEASRIMSVTYEIQVHAINSVQPPDPEPVPSPSLRVTSANPMEVRCGVGEEKTFTVDATVDHQTPDCMIRYSLVDTGLVSQITDNVFSVNSSSPVSGQARINVQLWKSGDVLQTVPVTVKVTVEAPIEAVMINPGREESVVSVNRIGLKIWTGTQGELDAVSPRDKNTLYIVME